MGSFHKNRGTLEGYRVDSECGPIVSVDWLMDRLGATSGLKIVDARPVDSYRAGHIPGALSSDQNVLQLPDSRPEVVAQFQHEAEAEIRRLGIEPGDRVIFYEDYSGASAARGVWLLDYIGFGGGAMLDGGLIAWHAAGGDLSRDLPTVQPTATRIQPDDAVLALAGEILDGISGSDPTILVLDTRNVIENRAGTIPTATHIDWTNHLDAEGRFRSLEEIADMYRDAGFSPDRPEPIVTFCGSGYRAAHTYVVLKALGYPSIKNYVPSWGEWGHRADLPVERRRR
jgi:thiosulfate/3-mercaptopyruvate sulfurtransferase